MRIAIIGGTAFIGFTSAAELAARGHELCFVHRGQREPDDLAPGQHVHVIDRNDLGSVREELERFGPDVMWDNMALTGAHARTALDTLGDGVRIVVTSSMDVYQAYTGVQDGRALEPLPIDESSPVRDERYPYRGKIAGMDDYEKLDVEEVYLARGATVLRLPMVYGARDTQRREDFILRRVRAGRTRIPVGSGTWLAAKGWVDDVARGIVLAIEQDHPGEVFNLGESRTYPMGAWAQMVLGAAGSDAELVRVPDDALPGDLAMTGVMPQHLLVDSSKARRALGWTDTPAVDTLRATVAWHLAHPPEATGDDFSEDDRALAES